MSAGASPASPRGEALAREALLAHPAEVAPRLLGLALIVDGVGGLITEVEAYDGRDDPAAHSFKGQTPRCASMFGPPGTLYVYRIHQSLCMNIATCEAGVGAAVLIRAIAPRWGLADISQRRGGRPRRDWTSGPGKLCQALGLSLDDDGLDICAAGSRVQLREMGARPAAIAATPRVGISKARERLWRFVAQLE